MMASNQTIVIDITARLKDETSNNINKLISTLNSLGNTVSNTQVNIDTVNRAITTTTQSAASLGATANSTQASATGLAGGLDGVQRSTTSLGNSTNRTRTSTDRFTTSMRRTEQQAQRLTRDRWLMRLDMVDRSAQSIQKVTNSIGNISNKTFSFTMKMTDLATKPLQGLMKLASNPIVAFGSVAGVSVGIKDTIDTFGNFEQTMANVHAITKSSVSDFKELKATAMHLGETTAFSANDVAQGMTYLGMAGWDKESIKSGLPGLLDLSLAGQTDLATTSDIVSDVMTAFSLDPTDMYNKDKGISSTQHVADVFAAAVTGSNTNVSMLGETLKYSAPIAHDFQMSLEDTIGMAGIMANSGIKSSQAGTTLRGAMTRLAKKPKEAKEELERFNIKLSDKSGGIRPIVDIVTDLGDAFSHLTQEEKLSSASKIFGVNAVSGWLAILDQGPDKLREFTKSIREADGAARKMADIEMDTLQGSFKLLQSAAEGVKIRFGDRLAPTLRRVTDYMTSSMPLVDRALSSFADKSDMSLRRTEERIKNLTAAPEWKNADSFSDKFTLAWDKIIEDPFEKWWSGSGQSFMADVANKLGSGIGGLYKGIAGLVFGFEDDDTGAVSIGKSFADGFIEGFDPETTAKRVMNGIGNIFSHSHFNIFGDKEDKSIVSTLMAGFMINKGLQLTGSIAGGVGTGARVLGGLIGGTAPAATIAPIATQPTVGLGGLGISGMTGAGAGSLLMPIALAGSFASATGGVISAMSDFDDALKTENKKLKRDTLYQGTTKTGLIAGGAGLGAAIGGLVIPGLGAGAGALIGAGLGGLASLFKGDDLGKFISDASDGTAEIDRMTESLKKAKEQADKMSFKSLTVDKILDEYDNLEKKIRNGNLSVEQRITLEDRQKGIIQTLSEMYPELVGLYDTQNKKLGETLKSIKELSKIDKDVANIDFEIEAIEAEKAIPTLTDNYLESEKELKSLTAKKSEKADANKFYQEQSRKIQKLVADRDKFYAIEDYDNGLTYDKQIQDKLLEISNTGGSQFGDYVPANNPAEFIEFANNYRDIYQQVNKDISATKEQITATESELTTAELSQIKLIEISHGFDNGLAEAAKDYNKMTQEQKDEFLKAKMEAQDYIETLKRTPKEVYTYIHLIGDNMSLSMIDPTYNILAANSVPKNGNNPLDDKSLESSAKMANGVVAGTKAFKEFKHATGGIFSTPHLGLVAEAGAEAIIPLSGANRERGKELWHQAGDRLGMFEEQKEIPTPYIGETRYDFLNSEEEAPRNSIAPLSVSFGSLGGVNITINGGTNLNDGKAIVKAIREQMPTIADELCEEIAIGVKKAFDNMPLASG